MPTGAAGGGGGGEGGVSVGGGGVCARGGAGAGLGAGAGRGASGGLGSGAENMSACGPPASAGRERLRQKRNPPPTPSASAASSHGSSEKRCSGASVAGGASAASGAKAGAEAGVGAAVAAGGGAMSVAAIGCGSGLACAVDRWAVPVARRVGVELSAVRRAVSREAGGGAVGCWAAAGRSAAGCCGGWSAGRVTLPCRLKFCSSRGPIVSAAGALVVGASWASAATGASSSPAVKPAIVKRQAPLIHSPLLSVNRAGFPRRDRHMPLTSPSFKHSVDEPKRTHGGYRASTSTSSASSSASMAMFDSPVIATPSRGPASTPFTRTRPLGTR